MARLDDLEQKVKLLYTEKLDSRDEWSDWLYPNHVLVVTSNAKQLAERVGADVELSQVAALLHDIADIKMPRVNPSHAEESLKLARQLMQECGYSEAAIKLVVDDAIRFHSCHGDEHPQNKEGLVLATADSLAHLQTGFYVFATWSLGKDKTLAEVRDWVLNKIERDLNKKIAFADIREAARPDYEMIKQLWSR